MDGVLLDYFIVGLLAILCIFAVAIGIDKMVKIVMGNYLLSAVTLAGSSVIDIAVAYLIQNADLSIVFGMNGLQVAGLLSDGKVTLVLLLYAILLFVIFNHSHLTITIPHADMLQQGLYLILVPLTVISVILTLQIAILGTKVLNVTELVLFASSFTSNVYLYNFLTLTPLRMLLHGVMTIMMTLEMKIRYKNTPYTMPPTPVPTHYHKTDGD